MRDYTVIDTKNLELQLIGCICYTGSFYEVPPEYLSNAQARAVYDRLLGQYRKAGKIESSILSEAHGEILALCDGVAFPRHAEPIAQALGEAYRANRAWLAAQKFIKSLPSGDSEALIADLHREISAQATQGREIAEYNHGKSFAKFLAYVEDGKNSLRAMRGITSHLPELDAIINGWQRGLSYVIGGLKKTGKSRFAINLASTLLSRGHGGIFFSLEMKPEQIHGCIISSRAAINTEKYGTSRIEQNDLYKMATAGVEYAQEKLYIDDSSGISPEYVRAMIRKIKITQPVEWVVVDYIQRMKVKSAEGRTKEVEHCASELANIGRDENVIMIELSQLSGEAEKMITNKTGQAPVYAYVKESQTIIEACDCAIMLIDPNRGKEYDQQRIDKPLRACILQRHGVSDVFIDISAELCYSRFSCIEKKQDEKNYADGW
jgi:replicative DNA helicase